MNWVKRMEKASTSQAMQPVNDRPASKEDFLANAGVMYAKAAACFEGVYRDMALAEQQQGRNV